MANKPNENVVRDNRSGKREYQTLESRNVAGDEEF